MLFFSPSICWEMPFMAFMPWIVFLRSSGGGSSSPKLIFHLPFTRAQGIVASRA